ncbi:hypothetical protein ACW5XW_06790 [Aeromonas piscicola]|uniref:hypothetical protein n=1 Tax=Aeromonas piscicola TaxID=600645 RepID=UPI0012E02DA2|nr:hypothetical protein [Aeromonas piscicola]
MKAIYISLLAMAFGVNATVVEYQLEQDGIVDGVITEGGSIDLKINKQQDAFSGYDESYVTRGYFYNNENVIRFDKTTKDTVSYYLGTKSENGQYKGNWYDSNGNGGDFRLLSSDVENEGCSGAIQTGQYCNMEIDGGGWQLVAVRAGVRQGIGDAVDKITTLSSSQYLNAEEWGMLKSKMKEVLFVQPNTGIWGIMNIAAASSMDLCKPLSDDLSVPVLVHAEDEGCNAVGSDYTLVGHPSAPTYQGNLYAMSEKYILWHNPVKSTYSDQLMVYVR